MRGQVIEMKFIKKKKKHLQPSNDAHRKTLHKNLEFTATEQYQS